MNDTPEHTDPNPGGRDIESDILRVLATLRVLTTGDVDAGTLARMLGRPVHDVGIALREPVSQAWIKTTGRAPFQTWSLTDDGMRVAEARGLVRSARHQ